MKTRLAAGILFVVAIGAAVLHSQTPRTYKVVFDVGEGGDAYFERVIQKIANLTRDTRLAGHLDIKIVAHSEGIDFMVAARNQQQSESIPILTRSGSGVTLEACNNSIVGHKLAQADLFPGVQVIESGIGELVLLQQQGYAYFKP
jgi:uncharacterized protein